MRETHTEERERKIIFGPHVIIFMSICYMSVVYCSLPILYFSAYKALFCGIVRETEREVEREMRAREREKDGDEAVITTSSRQRAHRAEEERCGDCATPGRLV